MGMTLFKTSACNAYKAGFFMKLLNICTSSIAHACTKTAHELENAAHGNELPRRQYTVVRAALAQMGVGGDNSWGARTHDEYLIDVSGKLCFTFCWEPRV